jgi:hypothetical protein
VLLRDCRTGSSVAKDTPGRGESGTIARR